MVAPGASSAARDAAVARLEAFGARLERLGLDDFRQLVPTSRSAPEHADARRAAEVAASAAGLADLVATARERSAAFVDQVYAGGGYHPTWVALNWGLSTGRVEDRLATTSAVQDAALATIVEDLVPGDVVDVLAGPFELIAEAGLPQPGGTALPSMTEMRRHGLGSMVVMAILVALVVLSLGAVGLAMLGSAAT